MQLQYGASAYRRDQGSLPELRLVNMFVEASLSSENGVTLQSRPGLTPVSTLSGAPIKALLAKDGVLGGATFAVAGASFYRDGTLLGSVSGFGPASMAASALEVLATQGDGLARYDGQTLQAVAFPDNATVTAIEFLAGYFIAARGGSQRFYWSAVLDGSSWDGLDYASAESSPDELRDLLVVRDELVLLGSETVEFWVPTGQAETPFIRSQGRLYRKGVMGTGCAAELDNALFWIGNDGAVYRGGDAVPVRLSDHGIEERVIQSKTHRATAFTWQGHAFFAVHLDSGCFAFDAATGKWCEFSTFGSIGWDVGAVATVRGEPMFGSSTSGTISRLSGDTDGDKPLQRLFSAILPLQGQVGSVDNVRLTANVGRTGRLEGLGSAPTIELRSSRDAGVTFGAWRGASLGAQGQYRARTEWRRLGMFDEPGALFEIRCTDPVPLRVSAVTANEAGGGRSR